MLRLLDWGIAPPYREPHLAGLKVRGMDGSPLYDATRSQRWFTGFDDVPAAAGGAPPLTTVAQPVMEKGRAAARILLEGGPPRHVVLPVTLVVRGSTAPPGRSA